MPKKEDDILGENEAGFDSKEMLLDNGAKGTKIRYSERLKVEIVTATKHYAVGDVINPHKVKGEALIAQGIAKEYKEPKKK